MNQHVQKSSEKHLQSIATKAADKIKSYRTATLHKTGNNLSSVTTFWSYFVHVDIMDGHVVREGCNAKEVSGQTKSAQSHHITESKTFQNMKIQQIITWRLPELCSYPEEMMFYLFIFLLHPNLSPSFSFFPSFFHPHNPPPPPPQSCQDVASFGLRLNGGDLASFPSPRSLQSGFFFLKSTHVYAPDLCTLWFSMSRQKLNPGLMCTGSPLCTCCEGEGGRQKEQKKSERVRERAWGVKRKWFSDFLHRLCRPGRLFICVFLSPLVRTRGDCAIHCLRAMLSLYI